MLFIAGCSQQDTPGRATQCRSEADCRSEEICQAGTCVDPNHDFGLDDQDTDDDAPDSAPDEQDTSDAAPDEQDTSDATPDEQDSDDAAPDDDDFNCPPGQLYCGRKCVDQHEGLCELGERCTDDEDCTNELQCSAGRCACGDSRSDAELCQELGLSCGPATSNCGDIVQCGSCNDSQVCSQGVCVAHCSAGETRCAALDGTGEVCAVLKTDVHHCGDCNQRCEYTGDNGSPICEDNLCGVKCDEGFLLCGDICVESGQGLCDVHEACEQNQDCESKVCSQGLCQEPTCEDGVKNGAETDRDCGGPDCGPCQVGDACLNDDDCAPTTEGDWGGCQLPAESCIETGETTRTLTHYECQSGACTVREETETGPCEQARTGEPCGDEIELGDWGVCQATTDSCTDDGLQHRTVTYHECYGGSCAFRTHQISQDCVPDAFDPQCCAGADCLMITPQYELDFSVVRIGEQREHEVEMRNNSSNIFSSIEIRNITITDDGGGAFSIREDSYPDGLPDYSYLLYTFAETTVTIVYSPTAATEQTGELLIVAADNFFGQREFRITLKGEGTTLHCPLANAQARLEGSTQWQESLRLVEPTTIELSSGGSLDPEGGPLTYEWAIIGRPASSTAPLKPSATDPNPTFKPDRAGSYTIELITRSDTGLRSCESSTVEIIYEPINQDIQIELSWYSDEVPAPDDNAGKGTDLDLFYKRANTDWASDSTAYWFHRNQNWGNQGIARLVSDSLYGGQPEVVTHTNPADDELYHVGVHYYDSKDNGASYATLRIYLNGILVSEMADHPIPNTNDLWWATIIQWGPNPQLITPPIEWVTDHGLPSAGP